MSKNFFRSFSCSRSHKIYIRSKKIKLGSTYAYHALWPLSYDLNKVQDRDKSANRCSGGITLINFSGRGLDRYKMRVCFLWRRDQVGTGGETMRRGSLRAMVSSTRRLRPWVSPWAIWGLPWGSGGHRMVPGWSPGPEGWRAALGGWRTAPGKSPGSIGRGGDIGEWRTVPRDGERL